MPTPMPIVFVDLRERDLIRKQQLEAEKAELKLLKDRHKGLPDDQKRRLETIEDVLKKAKEKVKDETVLDPTFRRLREKLGLLCYPGVGEHVEGKFPTQRQDTPEVLSEPEKRLAAIYGIMEADGVLNDYDPRLDINQDLVAAFNSINNRPQAAVPAAVIRFDEAIATALGEYLTYQTLFEAVMQVLVNDGHLHQNKQIRADEWARVVRALRNDQIPHNAPSLPRLVTEALGKVAGSADGIPSSTMAIDLPVLDDRAGFEISREILEGVQPWIFAMPLEEMGFFTAMDMALEDWQHGLIVLRRGQAGDRFYNYWRASNDRLSELERRSFYARLFGLPGGTAEQRLTNRDFKSLWIRFLAAVSRFYRQTQVDSLLQSNIPVAVSQEQVRQSGRDLAANLCVNAHGFTFFAALEIQKQIEEIIETFKNEEVMRAYGAADMFQVIEQILSSRGMAIGNSVQKRVSANAGAIIVRWLAENGLKLSSAALGEVLPIDSLLPTSRPPGSKATTTPTNYDLVNAVEQWLAVNGVQEQYIEEQAQAMEPPRTPTRPFPVPDIVREHLSDLPIPMAAGAGNGRAVSHGNGNGYGRR